MTKYRPSHAINPEAGLSSEVHQEPWLEQEHYPSPPLKFKVNDEIGLHHRRASGINTDTDTDNDARHPINNEHETVRAHRESTRSARHSLILPSQTSVINQFRWKLHLLVVLVMAGLTTFLGLQLGYGSTDEQSLAFGAPGASKVREIVRLSTAGQRVASQLPAMPFAASTASVPVEALAITQIIPRPTQTSNGSSARDVPKNAVVRERPIRTSSAQEPDGPVAQKNTHPSAAKNQGENRADAKPTERSTFSDQPDPGAPVRIFAPAHGHASATNDDPPAPAVRGTPSLAPLNDPADQQTGYAQTDETPLQAPRFATAPALGSTLPSLGVITSPLSRLAVPDEFSRANEAPSGLPRRASVTSTLPLASALQEAARKGQASQLNRLLVRGAPLNAADTAGYTPLMLAVIHNHPAMVQRLLAAGAAVGLVDRKGATALQHARQLGRNRIATLIESAS